MSRVSLRSCWGTTPADFTDRTIHFPNPRSFAGDTVATARLPRPPLRHHRRQRGQQPVCALFLHPGLGTPDASPVSNAGKSPLSWLFSRPSMLSSVRLLSWCGIVPGITHSACTTRHANGAFGQSRRRLPPSLLKVAGSLETWHVLQAPRSQHSLSRLSDKGLTCELVVREF